MSSSSSGGGGVALNCSGSNANEWSHNNADTHDEPSSTRLSSVSLRKSWHRHARFDFAVWYVHRVRLPR